MAPSFLAPNYRVPPYGLLPGSRPAVTVDDFILRIPLGSSPGADVPNRYLLVRLEQARTSERDSCQSFNWYRFVRLVFPRNPNKTPNNVLIHAALPLRSGQARPETRLLDGPTSFQSWLSAVSRQLTEDGDAIGRYLAVSGEALGPSQVTTSFRPAPRPARPAPRPARPAPQPTSPVSLLYIESTMHAVIRPLYQLPFTTNFSHIDRMCELFQLPSADNLDLQRKVLPGMNPACHLYAHQLEGLYRMINRKCQTTQLAGQILADEEGLSRRLMLVAYAHPEEVEKTMPPGGFTTIVCEPRHIKTYAKIVAENVMTTMPLDDGPFSGKPFLSSYTYETDGQLKAIPGLGGPHQGTTDLKNLTPELDKTYNGIALPQTPPGRAVGGVSTARPTPIEEILGSGGDGHSGHSLRYHGGLGGTGARRAASSSPLPHPQSQVAQSDTLLILSRDLLESGAEKSLELVTQWPGSGSPDGSAATRSAVEYSIYMPLYAANIFVDIDQKAIVSDSRTHRWLVAQRVRCSQGKATRPLLVVMSPSPFIRSRKDVHALFDIIFFKPDKLKDADDKFDRVMAQLKLLRCTHDGRPSLPIDAKLERLWKEAATWLNDLFIARDHSTRITKTDNVVTIRSATTNIGLSTHRFHPTPSQHLGQLSSACKNAGDDVKGRQSGENATWQSLALAPSFQLLYRAASIPALLGGDGDGLDTSVGVSSFPLDFTSIQHDLPSADRGGQPIPYQETNANGEVWARRVIELARHDSALDDAWLRDTVKILGEALNGRFWDPDGCRPTEADLDHPRHAVISCPSLTTTLHVYYALSHICGHSIEAYLLTSEWPPPARRGLVVNSWIERASELDSQNSWIERASEPASRARGAGQQAPKLLVAIVHTSVLASLPLTLPFATIFVQYGQPMAAHDAERAASRVRQVGLEERTHVYSFSRSDNPALLAIEDIHHGREGSWKERFS
ncbi:hypothetical protein FALBO_5607 [Fusarium albosuccineum]|uniref:Uncharacterized protein n=1 Tax=Fusarium albosuccineum TaxID=1237068 RepID=A0A8H4LGG7_9HYPO|nr:hypothetical protein FALBO_5607 [Fusarium albosuccineum]